MPFIPADMFIDAPAREPVAPRLPELDRLIRKFDPAERDRINRALGNAGEEFVYGLERARLLSAGREDLARKVRWVSHIEGDGAGYDILSFDSAGHQKLIEVKTTNGPARTPFFLSRNEHEVAEERAAEWRLYRVHQFAQAPKIFTIAPPLADVVNLRTEVWRASF